MQDILVKRVLLIDKIVYYGNRKEHKVAIEQSEKVQPGIKG